MTKTVLRYVAAVIPFAFVLAFASAIVIADAPNANAYVPSDYTVSDPQYPLTPNDLIPCTEEDGSIPDGWIGCYWDVNEHGGSGTSFVVMRADDGGVFFAYENSRQTYVGADGRYEDDVTGCTIVVGEVAVYAEC